MFYVNTDDERCIGRSIPVFLHLFAVSAWFRTNSPIKHFKLLKLHKPHSIYNAANQSRCIYLYKQKKKQTSSNLGGRREDNVTVFTERNQWCLKSLHNNDNKYGISFCFVFGEGSTVFRTLLAIELNVLYLKRSNNRKGRPDGNE